MSRLTKIRDNRRRRQRRTRAAVASSNNRPRLSVKISARHVSAQIIDDRAGQTLAAASTFGKKLKQPLTAQAELVGQQIGQAAKKASIKQVVFDRGQRQYHGRIKALAEAARSQGLEF